jgi:hypothetical protein
MSRESHVICFCLQYEKILCYSIIVLHHAATETGSLSFNNNLDKEESA